MLSVPRRDALARIRGGAGYVADFDAPDALYGVTVRSTISRGRIRAIRYHPGFPWRDCAIVTAEDIPGQNAIAHILAEQPCLAAAEIRHWGEPILLIAHSSRYLAEQACQSVAIEYDEEQPPVLDPERSTQLFKEYRRNFGDPAAAFSNPDLTIVEGEYRTPAVDQLYIEPQGMLATATLEDGITIRGSLQCPFYVHHALQQVFPNLPVRVIACETGGGFGGKEDYPSILACHSALLAWKSKCPVRMIYSRREDLAVTPKRHPSRTRIRSAWDAQGLLVALDIDFLIDGGAYTTLSPVVLSRGLLHAAGPYFCPNVSLHGRAVMTNHPPHGAFRGFGVPQSCFAMETHLDVAAARLGLLPGELRRRNLLRPGQQTPFGQTLPANFDLGAMLDHALAATGYHARQARPQPPGPIRRGIGLSMSFHGTGFTGSGERMLDSEVIVRLVPEGRLQVFVSSVDMGQGSSTVLAQIAANAYGCYVENVDVSPADTALVPNSGPTVASRTTAIVGPLVARAARELRAMPGQTEARARYQQPAGLDWDDATFSGDAYCDYSWAVQVAEVTVDTDTGETQVDRITAVVDAGQIVNPALARGQIEGGIVQGVGFALSEETLYDRNGAPMNAQLTNTIIPTSADAPSMDITFVESRDGVPKGLGELPLDGAAPAITNAIAQAIGAPVTALPATPERVLDQVTTHD